MIRTARPVLLMVLLAGLSVAVFLAAAGVFRAAEHSTATARARLYLEGLDAALERYAHLPFVIATDPLTRAGAEGGDLEALNARLAAVAERSSLEAIYLMDRSGLTIAASNHDQPVTFLGANYGFRPYFTEAIAGRPSAFFAIGATTHRPGYFLSEPVRDTAGGVVGVIAIKLDLRPLAESWAEGDETVLVTNRDGIAILTSDPELEFRPIAPIAPDRLAGIREERQFAELPLEPLDWQADAGTLTLGGRSYLHVTHALPATGWTLHYLSATAPIWQRASLAVAAILAAVLLGVILWMRLRTRRMRRALQFSQAERRSLRQANRALQHEIAERRRAEARLEDAQSELRRSSKLAALGQLAASVTHELGQPIAAMKSHLAAAEMTGGRQPLLDKLGALVTRIEAITTELKFFARPGPPAFDRFDLRAVWSAVSELMAADFAARPSLKVAVSMPEAPVTVEGNAMRLEQVLVNILRNALLATDETTDARAPRIALTIRDDGSIVVADNGPGLGGRSLADLQEPFHTTRESGEGLGLGLAIASEILREHGGALTASDAAGDAPGARFEIRLPLARNREAAA